VTGELTTPAAIRRVVCLTEETTETLYRLGLEDRIVGISGFTQRPAEARRDKPIVCTFLEARYDAIDALTPDLVIGFSDLQADIARELVHRGHNVVVFNQRSVPDILRTILQTGALVGAEAAAARLVDALRAGLEACAARAATLPRRPRVFFEEWHDPLISGIRWVSELIEIAGGVDVCAETRAHHDAQGRILDPAEVAARDPEVVIASWCGKLATRAKIVARPGWAEVSAVSGDHLYELRSDTILQPGPAALTDGLAQLEAILRAAVGGPPLEGRTRGGLRHAEALVRGVPPPESRERADV
jgi:iron complex transport system substrate-binding protein